MLARPVEQHVKHGLIILADDSGEQIDDLTAGKRREAPDHAEVDERDAVAREIEHVTRVRISVKKAVEQDHLEHGIGAACRQYLAVESRASNGRQLSAANPSHILLQI